MSISQRLIKIREFMGLSPEKIGPMCYFSARSWRYYEESDEKALNIPASKMVKVAEVCNVDLVWLLTGQGEMIKSDQPNQNGVVKFAAVVENHMELVKGFKNHEKAKQINEKLIELEGLNEDLLNDVDDQINIMLRTARRMSEKFEKKTGNTPDRRVNKQPHKGHDRRKAG